MKYGFHLAFAVFGVVQVFAQPNAEYQQLRQKLVAKYHNKSPGRFTSFGSGVKVRFATKKKIIALTFDACGGPNRGRYDEELIQFLRDQKIPATLFISGLWLDEHPDLVRQLAGDPLFEIENHGLTHRPCSACGASRYGIKGTTDVGDAVDEIELNARKLQDLTGRKPVYYRSSTATSDEVCSEIARDLGETIVNFDILSGDAVARTASEMIASTLIKKAHMGAIIIMHMNHPEWDGCEALMEAIPQLQKQGYSFVKLQNQALRGVAAPGGQ